MRDLLEELQAELDATHGPGCVAASSRQIRALAIVVERRLSATEARVEQLLAKAYDTGEAS